MLRAAGSDDSVQVRPVGCRERDAWLVGDDAAMAPGGEAASWWTALRSAAAASSAIGFSQPLASRQGSRNVTFETLWRRIGAEKGLDGGDEGEDATPKLVVLGLDGLLLADGDLQVQVWLLALELLDLSIEAFDLVLGALADGALGLSVVGTLALELLGGEIRDAARRRRRRATSATFALQAVARGAGFGRVELLLVRVGHCDESWASGGRGVADSGRAGEAKQKLEGEGLSLFRESVKEERRHVG